MHRRTTTWVAGLWSLLFGTAAHALSLGDIEVYSALGYPLEAEILLTSVRPGETEGMLVRLASEDAFAQAGVDRPFFLTKIRFQLATKPDGTQYIFASTDNPVNEPFLNFLIDIDWPRGHLVREYTVLLDPAVFTGTGQAPDTRSADSLPTIEDTESAAGEPSLIERDEVALTEEDLPDIEMVDEAGTAVEAGQADGYQAAEAGEPVLEETQTADTSVPAGTVAGSTEAWLEEGVPQEAPSGIETADAAVTDVTDDSSLSERLEQQPLPDISFSFDESLPYDAARTEALLSEFGISLSSLRPTETKTKTAEQRPDSYEVQAGDTLWEIASQHKDSDVSVQQAMLAILRYNPNGFIRNNINDVKKGFVLRMPERQAMLEISRQEAVAEAQRQYALWREYRGELAGIGSTRQDAATADRLAQKDAAASGDKPATGGQLSILAPGRDAKSTARSSGAQEGDEKGLAATKLDLQLAREQLEAERLEKTELQSRLTDLNGQIETMQRMLTLKDEQLAKLQERLRKLEAAKTAPPAETSKAKPEDPKAKANQAEPPVDAGKIAAPKEKKPADTAGTAPDGTTRAAPQPEPAAKKTKDTDIEKLDESISLEPKGSESPVKEPAKKPRISKKPVTEAAPQKGKSFSERLNAVLQPAQGFLRDLAGQHIKNSTYKKMVDDLLATPAGLAVVAGVLVFVLVLLISLVRALAKVKDNFKARVKKPKKKANPMTLGSDEHLEELQTPQQLETTRIIRPTKPGLNERLKKAFAPFAAMLAAKKKPKPKAKALFSEEDEAGIEPAAADEDLSAAVQAAAVEVKSKAKPSKAAPVGGETVKVNKPVQQSKAAAASAPAPAAAEEEVSDDTTAEADVYLAYGLFDQAEELLKHALAGNSGATHYRGKLLETYFAAGKKDEFEKLAAELHKSMGNRSSRIWDKAVAMGKEIAPANPLFSGAADSGLKASDFAPAKPATADLDLGEAGGATTPDVDFGEVGATETALDLDISGAFDKTLIADSDETMIMDAGKPMPMMSADADADSTMIVDDSTLLVDETSLDSPKPRDVTDSELNIDFDADELGLGGEEADAGGSGGAAESTMAMDIGLDIDNVDGITDVDHNSGSFNSGSAGDDLIAELGGDDSELSLVDASDTEFDLPEDDDTIIDAGEDDTVNGDSGGADEVSTKLDLARAYMDMGDYDGASSTLEEVLSEGSDKQKREAEELLDQIN